MTVEVRSTVEDLFRLVSLFSEHYGRNVRASIRPYKHSTMEKANPGIAPGVWKEETN